MSSGYADSSQLKVSGVPSHHSHLDFRISLPRPSYRCRQLDLLQALPVSQCRAPLAWQPPASSNSSHSANLLRAEGFSWQTFLAPPPQKPQLGSPWHTCKPGPGHSLSHLCVALSHAVPLAQHHPPMPPICHWLCTSHPTLLCRPHLFANPPPHHEACPVNLLARHTQSCVLPQNGFQVASRTYLALPPRLQSLSRSKPCASFE